MRLSSTKRYSVKQLEVEIANHCQKQMAPESSILEPLLERHRAWIAFMWDCPCSPDAYAGLADLYMSHPDFRRRYDSMAAGFCEYLVTAMKSHAGRQKQ